MILINHSSSDGRLKGTEGGERSGLANTFTKRTISGPDSCFENGCVEASLTMSRAGQIMISHLNGNFRESAARKVDSLTSLRTTKVPTAPILTTSNLANSFAIVAGRHRFAPPTLTARRKTTRPIRKCRRTVTSDD